MTDVSTTSSLSSTTFLSVSREQTSQPYEGLGTTKIVIIALTVVSIVIACIICAVLAYKIKITKLHLRFQQQGQIQESYISMSGKIFTTVI
jgi:hypothetical protein